jgi:hypothetical protein
MILSGQHRLFRGGADESTTAEPCAAASGSGPSRLQSARLVGAVAQLNRQANLFI